MIDTAIPPLIFGLNGFKFCRKFKISWIGLKQPLAVTWKKTLVPFLLFSFCYSKAELVLEYCSGKCGKSIF